MTCISVVLPVYNAEAFLDHCLEMLSDQTLEDFEIIAVNDGSTDDSQALLETWTIREKRLTIITQENRGAGIARNVGMDHANGDYILFLDPDDAFSPHYLSSLYETARNSCADITICASSIFDLDSGEATLEDWTLRKDLIPNMDVFSGTDVADNIFRMTIGWPWDKLINLDFLKRTGLRYPPIKNSEDGVLIFSALCLADRISVIYDPLIQHTMNRSSSLSNSRKNNALCFFEAIRMVKDILLKKNIYDTFERGYINWALNYCLWNLDTAHKDDQLGISEYLRTSGFKEIGIFEHPESYYYVPEEYRTAEFIEKYQFPECLVIAGLEQQLEAIKNSRALRVGELIAKPVRVFKETRHKKTHPVPRLG